MTIISKRWQVASSIPSQIEQELLDYPPILRQILYNRGYTTHDAARRYLEALPPEGAEPSAMLGIPEAVDRIYWAIKREEPIAVYGDYDADGVTATALLTHALRSLGADVLGYIPNRFDEGYGLNFEALDALHSSGVRLVITVDCGVRSVEEAEHARKLDLDMIITDHHQPGPQLPLAQAVINPKQTGDTYPDKNLAGVGLAYKLTLALFELMSQENRFPGLNSPAVEYLDLVALGTVTDLAPLVDENRSLVRSGLEYIRRPHRQGLMSLIGVSRLIPNQIEATHISFVLGPRLNAAGRLDSAQAALNLLLTQDVAEAAHLAQLLDNQNRERQQITREIQAHAEQTILADDPEALLLFAANEDYNPGVVGLAAARLQEQYYRPSIVAHKGPEFTRGSCRSIPEFHITQALDECADLLTRHGGHAAAAGFTVPNEKLQQLVERLNAITKRELAALNLRPTLCAEAEIPLYELRPELLDDLARLEPTGHKNPQPQFISRNLRVLRSRTVGQDNAHLKLTVSDGRITYDAIAFRQGQWQEQMPSLVDLLYVFETNEYNGRSQLQLNVRDLKPAGA
ncbi:MAG: single-stranded-DNA-specific exonuclease RecJ [Anaerolineales bacterium]|nr:single-stranded-DNA-specific exonuclease RecJ [Anaerolineales bacterium]